MGADLGGQQGQEGSPVSPAIKNNLRKGVEFFNTKRYEQAIAEWSKVLREDPTNRKALDFILKARTRLAKDATPEEKTKVVTEANQFYEVGSQYFEEEEYQMAINQWIRAITLRPDRGDILEKIQEAQSRIASGAAPTKASAGKPRELKMTDSSELPVPAAQEVVAKKKEEDNKALAAEAEALYDEILGNAGAKPQKPGMFATVTPKGGKQAVAVPAEPGIVSDLIGFPARHPFWFLAILAVAVGVFVTLYYTFMAVDYTQELAAARSNAEAGEWFKVVSHLNKANDQMPDDEEIIMFRGEAYTHLTDWDNAAADFERVTGGLNPGNTEAWKMLGLSLNRLNRFEDALAALEKAKDDADVETRKEVLVALENLGRQDEYVDWFPVQNLEEQPATILVKLGRHDLLTRNYEEAKQKGEVAVSKTPSEQAPYLLLTRALYEMGEAQGAIGVANEGIAAMTLCPQLYYLKARIQQATGDFEGSIATMREAEGQGGDYRYHVEIGNIWLNQYRKTQEGFLKDKAINAYKDANELDDDGYASLAMGRALRIFGDKAEATKHLKLAASRLKGPESDEFGYSYRFVAYYLLGQYDEAVAIADKNIAAREEVLSNLAAKGIALHAKGDKAGAKLAFQEAQDLQKGRTVVAPIEYADLDRAAIEARMKEVGL